MRRGKRQVQLDDYLLRVLENAPCQLKGRWFSLDSIDDWAVEWSEDEPPDFDKWFMKFPTRARFMAVYRSMERLAELGRVQFRRDRRSTLDSLQYRALNVLDALAAAAKGEK